MPNGNGQQPNGSSNQGNNGSGDIVIQIDGREVARAVNKANSNNGSKLGWGGNLNYGGSYAGIPFPGLKGIKKYTPVDWQGEKGDFRFSDIAFDGSRVTMTALLSVKAGVRGVIRNTAARPVRGAKVSIYDNSAAPAPVRGRMQLRSQAKGTPLMSVTTDVDGSYTLEDSSLADGSFTLVVTCDGYVEAEEKIEIGRQVETRDFYLRKVGESTESTFLKYDPEGSFFPFGYGDP